MLNCCTNTTYLGCFDTCQDINTEIKAIEAGIHVIELSFLSIKLKKEITLAINDDIVLPKIFLNENSEFLLRIKTPSGYLANCYTFETKACLSMN